MSKSRLALATVNVVVLALAVVTLLGAAPQSTPDPRLLDEPLAAPGNWFDSQRAIGQDRAAYARAVRQSAKIARRTARVAPDVAQAQWSLLGPTNIGGRANDVVVDPKAADTVYIAAASGGVWKSTDAGETFTPSWPDDITQAVGALEIAPDGTLYAGTGEANPGGGSIVYGGTGMYRSTDGAKTWEHVGLDTAGAFGRIAVDPTNPQRVFAAASGNLFVPGGERGLYRSDDGGDTWERVLAGVNDTTGAVDVSIDPRNPDNVLVGMWDHFRDPDRRVYAGPGSGVWRSTDGGDTWTRAAEITMPDPAETGRIGVAFSPADPDRAYALIANKLDGTHGAWFRSDDGGATWDKLPDNATLKANGSSYGWWFARVFPDPDEVDRVFVAGLELMASTDGGRTFLQMGNVTAGVVTGAHQVIVHADQHGMAWDPKVPGRVYLANDGGVYRSDADGNIGTWKGALVQGFTQHYSVDVFEGDPAYVVTGLQDNMCQRTVAPDDGAVTKTAWTKYGLCGDGLQTLIHPENPAITYSCSQYGNCGREYAGAPLTGGWRKPPGQRYGWFTPLEFDPTNPEVMYFGSNVVSRSTNGGQAWTQISGDLADPEGDLVQLDPNPGYRLRGVITAIGVSAGDPQRLYAGTDNGRLWMTRDQGATWSEISDAPGLPGMWITRITVDPADPDVAYVAYSSYRDGSDAAHLVVTHDAGESFTDLSAGLPQAPVNDVVLTGDGLAAATDVGVFTSTDGGQTWLRLGGNLPTVPVLDLRYHAGTDTLTAATFGHGIQRIAMP
ncbi:MAG TPA: hypothetical protein VM307_06595 [Egibacteraceae bacterium]|nr:hypothetical protein [Egibacteraceae bacterium]